MAKSYGVVLYETPCTVIVQLIISWFHLSKYAYTSNINNNNNRLQRRIFSDRYVRPMYYNNDTNDANMMYGSYEQLEGITHSIFSVCMPNSKCITI